METIYNCNLAIMVIALGGAFLTALMADRKAQKEKFLRKTHEQTIKELRDKHNLFIGVKNELITPYDLNAAETRQTGTSTGLALGYISKALLYPGQSIKIVDHHGTKQANELLLITTRETAKSLKLDGLTFSRASNSVKFDCEQFKGIINKAKGW